jgi:ribonuclease HI
MSKITIYFDGSCLVNPTGRIGYGAVIISNEEVVELWDGDVEHEHNSNNTAEYRGLCLALNWVKNNCTSDNSIHIHGDSMLAIKQMNGQWRIKKGGYKDDAIKAKELVAFIRKVKNIKIEFLWVRRELNVHADILSNKYHEQG